MQLHHSIYLLIVLRLALGCSILFMSIFGRKCYHAVLAKGINIGLQALFKLVSAMETSLARDLMSDEEWAVFEQFIRSVRVPNGRKPTNHRLVLDGIFWIARTGAAWRDLPEEFGRW